MPRRRQMKKRDKPQNLEQLSERILQEIADKVIEECQKLVPDSAGLSDNVEIITTPSNITLRFNSVFNPILLPAKYAGESVFKPRGINPNSGEPYGYSADTKRHFRTTKTKGKVPVMAHTKYYKLGFKPVEGRGGWYTASPKNNFGLRMAELRIERNFVQGAYDKVYRKLPQQIRKQLPKAIQIKE